MRYFALFIVFTITFEATYSDALPKDCFGKYGGEMPSYTVDLNGASIDIDKHDIYITIDAEQIIYKGGKVELSGLYSVFRQNRDEYLFKTKLTNGKSLSYDFDFILNRKEQKVYITPKNGQSEAVLEYMGG